MQEVYEVYGVDGVTYSIEFSLQDAKDAQYAYRLNYGKYAYIMRIA